jgi:hypothetical protein
MKAEIYELPAHEMKELVSELRTELADITADGMEIWTRQDRARRVRFCQWEGQSADGRKHAADTGEDAWPFEGAADSRVPLVDGIINDKVAIATQAFFRAQVQAVPIESSDAGRAQSATTLIKWLRDRALRHELSAEVELSAQYLYGDDPGVVVLEVQWRRDFMLESREVTFDELGAMYASGSLTPGGTSPDDARLEAEMLADWMDLATNKTREREALAWLDATFPGVTASAMKSALRGIRSEGLATLPVPVQRNNRPAVQALRLFDDIFFPVGTADIQRARHVHRREWLNEVELRERVSTLRWDAEWVDEVIERGMGQTIIAGDFIRQSRTGGLTLSNPGTAINERDHLFEIWWSYERRADELGVPGIYCTVWCGTVRDTVAKSELVDYPHGDYPFILRGRERLGRQVTESRGVGRAIETHQLEIKVQRDARSNYTQLATTPPRKVKMQRGAWDLVLGPGGNVPVQRMDDFEYLNPPPFPQASIEIERTTRDEANEYSARMTPTADRDRTAALNQHEVDNFFGLWREAFGQMIALCQAYYSPLEMARILGPGSEQEAVMTAEDIRGGYDVYIEIDARDLNMEYAMKKLEAYGKIRSMDIGGLMDAGPLVEWAAAALDPVLARRTIRPQQAVSQMEVKAEKDAVAQMAVGIEPEMPTQGINAQLRLQTLVQTIQQSQQLTQLYQVSEPFRELADTRQKYLQQQLDQEQNKLIGRLGVAPVQGASPSAGGIAGSEAMPAM